MTENLALIPFLIFPIIIILVLGFYASFQKLKKSENENIKLIYLELSSEKKIANQLKNSPKKVMELDNSIQQKLLKIKIDIFNIDFTLSEIF